MDWQYLFNMVAGAGMLGVGWWCRQIWDSVQNLKKDVQSIEVALPTNYVRKVDSNLSNLTSKSTLRT